MSIALQTPLFTLEVPEKGAAKGHARILSASSSSDDIALLGFCASVLSNVLYEKMQAGGTSIVISIAKDDVRADILARHEDDGVDLQWELKPGDPAQLDAVQERIRAKTFFIKNESPAKMPVTATPNTDAASTSAPSPDAGSSPSKASQAPHPGAADTTGLGAHTTSSSAPVAPDGGRGNAVANGHTDDEDDEKDDYLVKQLHRVP